MKAARMTATEELTRAARLGRKIRVRRFELGLSQQDIADELGCSQTSVSNWERGVSEPAGDTALRLADLLSLRTTREQIARLRL